MFNHEPKDYKCPLCIVAQGGETDLNKRSDIIYKNDTVVAYISPKWWVNNPGNVMVIPHKHIENIYNLSKELLYEVYSAGKEVARAMKEVYKCDGISFRQHNEPAGGQVVWHFHLHVFPRWNNDNLYINHKNTRHVTVEERAPYAQKLRKYFSDQT